MKATPVNELNELILTIKEFATHKYLKAEEEFRAAYAVGDEVEFEKGDERITGTVIECSYATARIHSDDGRYFVVNYSMLKKQSVITG